MTCERPRYRPIEDHGVIGDLHTVALVALDGSIDFLCFPRFDSPSVFAALLDADRGGRFAIEALLPEPRFKQLYLPDTNVLLTRTLSEDGVAEITDFMPVEEVCMAHDLVRQVKSIRGEVSFRMTCAPRFDYARATHRVERLRDGLVFVSEGPDRTALRLRGTVPIQVRDGDAVAEFTLRAGECASFVLENAENDGAPADLGPWVTEAFQSTVDYWRRWIRRSTYRGRWRDMVDRSALVLKLLTSQRYGSIVASPTFGLPEEIGGVRNWDYRYTWIRDASFTVYALSRIGLHEEAGEFARWVERECEDLDGRDTLQVLYRVDGSRDVPEEVLTHLEGYQGSRPVRIGNAAVHQLQLDIYGELMDAIHTWERFDERVHHDLWEALVRLIDWVCANWDRPDEGIWEIRATQEPHTYSRVMCWVALDRALQIARRRSLPAPFDRWRRTRDEIYRDVFTRGWSEERRAFVRSGGAHAMDASILKLPLVDFIGARDPRWTSTMRAVEEELVEDSLVYRYRTAPHSPDGIPGHEATFSLCSFWYVECLSRAGELTRARLAFEKLLSYANHVGLYSEELGRRGEHLGNFPLAFTHLALISAAHDLDARLDRAGQD